MRLRPIVGQPGSSSIISRVKLGQTTVQLGKRAGFDDVGHRLGLTTGAQISVCKTPCLSTGTAMLIFANSAHCFKHEFAHNLVVLLELKLSRLTLMIE